MQTKFRFTNAAIKALPHNHETQALLNWVLRYRGHWQKLLSGEKARGKRFLLRYTLQGKKRSIALGRFGDIDVSQAGTIARKVQGDAGRRHRPGSRAG